MVKLRSIIMRLISRCMSYMTRANGLFCAKQSISKWVFNVIQLRIEKIQKSD
jgi:hypothetical protein